jgi:hypothetical protein
MTLYHQNSTEDDPEDTDCNDFDMPIYLIVRWEEAIAFAQESDGHILHQRGVGT